MINFVEMSMYLFVLNIIFYVLVLFNYPLFNIP